MSVRALGGIGGPAARQLKSYRVAGRRNHVAYCTVPSPSRDGSEMEKEKRPAAEHDESKNHACVADGLFQLLIFDILLG